MIAVRDDYGFLGIPLPTDLVPGDEVKICGHAWVSSMGHEDDSFYIGVGYLNCSEMFKGADVFTLIPTTKLSYITNFVCFSSSITLTQVLPSCETMLVVGMMSANDDEYGVDCRFTYTLDAIKYCNGPNLLIRLCCDPAYYEIIVNNGVAIGSTFSDTDGYCWEVDEETTLSITGSRIKATDYANCTACTTANPCPENYQVESCCGITEQIFVPVMVGVDVGDSFVDTYGNCWRVVGTVPVPITNVVFAGTVYNEQNCGTCTTANPCPNFYKLVSCCNSDIGGISSSLILPGYSLGDVFVDQFGLCWKIAGSAEPDFPTLGFLTPITDYGTSCESCTSANECPSTVFYEVQNCCTEDIEVLEWSLTLNIGGVVAFNNPSNVVECYKILAFTTGPATITMSSTISNNNSCEQCIQNWMGQCPPTP
jgi:hypothetical protein